MYNFIDGDYFESLSDFSFGDMYSTNFIIPKYDLIKSIFEKFEYPIFFIETHRVPLLFNELRKFEKKCRVISHNSDYTFGGEIVPHIPKNVDRFWCQNYNHIETDVIKSLPIGLERKRWFPEQKKQETLFEMMSNEIDRTELVYMNFNPSTNPIRYKIFNELKDKEFINKDMVGNGGNYVEYLKNLKKHKFVISPPGNGIDCHRNWEALYLGCIPIVLDSNFTRNVFSDLSVLRINDFNNLNEEVLKNYFTHGFDKNFDKKYLKLS
jgi:hypothetical protein